ncbi:MAG: response regulator transcription factor [Leptolyngbya sp. SIO1E4]|nr:response regulator transcription factor [Leptolyngbya sp. SIO1E4]
MKILVVEDDLAVAQTLQILLSTYYYAVDIAVDGEAGLEMADAFDYDLVLLDIWLPGIDGFDFCQQLRATGFRMPILVLTAQDGGSQKANALNAGADDYVVKPFDVEELMARVQALLRRGRIKTQPILTWGNLSVEPSSCSVRYGTQLLPLTPKEYGILELFLRNPRRVFSARTILDQVWNSTESPGEEVVRVHLKEVRKKLKAVGVPGDFIKTIHRTGYRLNPSYAAEITSQADEPSTALQRVELQPRIQADCQLEPQGEEQRKTPSYETPKPGGAVAQDLNNVFTSILGIVQFIRLTQKGIDKATQERLLLLEAYAKRGASLVRQILNFKQDGNEELSSGA